MTASPDCEFTRKLTLEERKAECHKIQQKYTDRIPTIIIRSRPTDFPHLENSKFLIPKDLTVGHFIYVLRTKIQLKSKEAIFIFVNGVVPSNTILINNIYDKYKSEDGFLYLTITSENTFG